MSNCLQLDCNPNIPVPTPTPLPPCEDGERCYELVDAGCVVYTGDALPIVNVDTNDRLDEIINNWAETVEGGTQAISTEETVTATPDGNGTSVAPLKVDVRVSTLPLNLLRVVDYVDDEDEHRVGLEVTLTAETISWILTQITENEDLNEQFCALVRPCLDNACGLPTDLTAEPFEMEEPND